MVAIGAIACYETKAAQLRVRTPNTEFDCTDVADRVFTREGFVATPYVTGARFYSPLASGTTNAALHWGIAVSIEGGPGRDGRNGREPCTFDLQALSPDESCGMQCPLTPQPGFDDYTRKMAGLLRAEFSVPGRAPDPDDR